MMVGFDTYVGDDFGDVCLLEIGNNDASFCPLMFGRWVVYVISFRCTSSLRDDLYMYQKKKGVALDACFPYISRVTKHLKHV